MANENHLTILKQGVDEWNAWRAQKGQTPDLLGACLRQASLSRANLSQSLMRRANLSRADLAHADLNSADLDHADLHMADLHGANLHKADLRGTNLSGAKMAPVDLGGAILASAILDGADLSGAHLISADLTGASAIGADFTGAGLIYANLTLADLTGASLAQASLGSTALSDLDLSQTKGLNQVNHQSPSTIGVDTLYKSKGQIPDVFLKGCGLADWQIEFSKLHRPDLTDGDIVDILYRVRDLRANQPIQISPLFLSYSHEGANFVDRMETTLNEQGTRYWRDTHHATAGPLEKQVDRAMRANDTVLLVLSNSSVNSDWVEHEVNLARQLEKEKKKHVLCPVALDDSWKTCSWEARLMEQIKKYNILDFSNWQDDQFFSRQFQKLKDGLQIFY